MSAILGNSVTGAGAAGAYAVNNSLRFRRGSPSYLSRTFSAGNLRLWTWSAWVKRGVLGTANSTIFDTNSSVGGEPRGGIKFQNDCLYFNQNPSGSSQTTELKSTAVYRDPSAWYHVVVAWDTAQATAANRVKLYINGVQVTAFQIATYPGQNTDSAINGARTHKLGTDGPNIAGEAFDGYLAEVNFIGGLALTPSSFGETNASTGVWQPKAYTGSYSGTNSFYQKYSSIATTSGSNTGLGQDFSGNGNYFNTNNISVTPGVTYDAMTDSPTPTSSTVGNYCVLNPINLGDNNTLSNANLTGVIATTAGRPIYGSFAVTSGKWYWETTYVAGTGDNLCFGVNGASVGQNLNAFVTSPNILYLGPTIYRNNTLILSGLSSPTVNDVIGIALDVDAGTISFYRNNTLQTTQNLPTGDGSGWRPMWINGTSAGTQTLAANFGQRPFTYTPPAGFNRLQTYNLPTPTIGASSTTLAGKYFNPVLYTGTGSARSVTGVGFQPDFVWVKERSSTSQHALFDVVRGVQKRIISDSAAAEDTSAQLLTAFNSDGFSVGTDGALNENTQTYVGWNWKANGTGVTNTAGSLTSTVSANTTSGFSVVTYTGNQTSGATVGHGLGIAPRMIIIKQRNVERNWFVGHTSIGWTRYFEGLNRTNAAATSSAIWNNTTPTSSVFTLGTEVGVNDGSGSYVAYCFAPVTGYSAFGSYTGNGSNDGPFIYTGFRPEYIMIKRTDSSSNWTVIDAARYPVNTAGPDNPLRPNTSEAETGGSDRYALGDILSNGFKLRYFDSSTNVNGGTYIYMAFAENPFNYSLAR